MDLRSYLAEEGASVPAFAAKIGVTYQALYRYMDGTRFPRRSVVDRIVAETNGRVTVADLFTKTPA